jgi:hypothetical protein
MAFTDALVSFLSDTMETVVFDYITDGNSRFGAAWQDYAASSVAMSKLHLYLRDASTTNASLQTSQWAGGGKTVDGCALLFDSSTVVLNGIENVFGFVLLFVRE